MTPPLGTTSPNGRKSPAVPGTASPIPNQPGTGPIDIDDTAQSPTSGLASSPNRVTIVDPSSPDRSASPFVNATDKPPRTSRQSRVSILAPDSSQLNANSEADRLSQSQAISKRQSRSSLISSLRTKADARVPPPYPSFHVKADNPLESSWTLDLVVHSVHELPACLTGEVRWSAMRHAK